VKRLGIFGGCFDPVHTGHLVFAECAREEFALEKVIFVPAGIPPHRPAPVASAGMRLEMVRLAVAGNPGFEVWDGETGTAGVSYSYDTVMRLKAARPGRELFFLAGHDAFVLLHEWRNARELAAEVTFLVAAREGPGPGGPSIECRAERVANPRIAISGTMVRRRAAEGRSIRYLVPDAVADLIMKENIYGRA